MFIDKKHEIYGYIICSYSSDAENNVRDDECHNTNDCRQGDGFYQ